MSQTQEDVRTCEIIINWLNSFQLGTQIQNVTDLADGILLFKLLATGAPDYFDVSGLNMKPHTQFAKISNIKHMKSCLERFFTHGLNQTTSLSDTVEPAAIAFGRHPKDFVSLIELVLLAVIKSPNKEEPISKMMALPEDQQLDLMNILEQILAQNGFTVDETAQQTNNGSMTQADDHMTTPIGKNRRSSGSAFGQRSPAGWMLNNSAKQQKIQSPFHNLSSKAYDKNYKRPLNSPFGTRKRKMTNSSASTPSSDNQWYNSFNPSSSASNNGSASKSYGQTTREKAFGFPSPLDDRQFQTTKPSFDDRKGSNDHFMSEYSKPDTFQPVHQPPKSSGLFGSSYGNVNPSPASNDMAFRLKADNRQMQEDLHKLQTEKEQLSKDNIKLKDEMRSLEHRVRNEMYEQFGKKENEYKSRITVLEDSERDLRQKRQVVQEEIIAYQEMIKELTADNDKLNAELSQLATLHDAQMREYRDELDIAKHQGNRVSSLESQLEAYKRQLEMSSDQREELNQMQRKNHELEATISDLKNRLSRIPKLKEQMEHYKKEMIEYKVKSIGNRGRNSESALHQRLKTLEADLLTTQQEKDDMCMKLKTARSEIIELQSEVDQARNRRHSHGRNSLNNAVNGDLQSQIGRLEAENQRLRRHHEDARSMKDLMQELDTQRQLAGKMQAKYRESQEVIEELQQKVKEAQSSAHDFAKSTSQFTQELKRVSDLEKNVGEKDKVIDILKQQIDQFRQERLKFQEHMGSRDSEQQSLKKQLHAITQYCEEQKKKIKEYHMALTQLHEKSRGGDNCTLYKEQIAQLKKKMQRMEEEYQFRYDSLKKENRGISNAFYGMAWQYTREKHGLPTNINLMKSKAESNAFGFGKENDQSSENAFENFSQFERSRPAPKKEEKTRNSSPLTADAVMKHNQKFGKYDLKRGMYNDSSKYDESRQLKRPKQYLRFEN